MNPTLSFLSFVAVLGSCFSATAYDQYQPLLPQRPSGAYQGPPVVPVILPGGYIADTEEVARAKEYHLNAIAQASNSAKDYRYNPAEEVEYSQPKYSAPVQQPLYTQYSHPQQPRRQSDYNVPQARYTGPVATPVSYQEPSQVRAYKQPAYSPAPQQKYQGPSAIPVILPNGYIAETADVEAAKQHHFQLVAQAQAAVARAQERDSKKYTYSGAYGRQQQEDDGQYDEQEHNYNQIYQTAAPAYRAPVKSSARAPYQGPAAVPVILSSGHIADTAEVAAAKISHLQQLLDAAKQSLPQQRYYR